MKTTHTPGPWESIGARICTEGNDRERRVIARMEPFDLNKMAERDANARLIAAAPDLLDALRECVTDEGAYSMTRDDLATLKMRIAAINATAKIAIAKAEGAQ